MIERISFISILGVSRFLSCLIVVFFLLSGFARAQISWEKTYGGVDSDVSYSVRQTADGGYIVAGWSYFTSAMMDVYLIKTDAWGDTLWTKTYGSSGQDAGESVQQTADGGYVIAGRTGSFPTGDDAYLIRANPQGDTLWTRTYGIVGEYEAAFAVQLTRDGGFIMTGVTFVGGSNAWLVKTDSRGDTLWTRNYGGASGDLGRAVQQTSDGGYIVGGWTYSFGSGDGDVYLIKTDSLGDTLWTRTYGSKGPDFGWDVKQTADGGYIVAGGFTDTLMGKSYCYLVKADANGDTLWTKTYGCAGTGDMGSSVWQTQDQGYIIAGTSNRNSRDTDLRLIKTDAQGDTLWTRVYGGPGEDRGLSVQQAADGGYIVSGYTDSFGAGLFDVYLVKTDANGNVGAEEAPQSVDARPFILSIRPSPVRVDCAISFALPVSGKASLAVYDALGRKVRVILDEEVKAGSHRVRWVASDDLGRPLPSGVYFLKLEALGRRAVQRVVVVR